MLGGRLSTEGVKELRARGIFPWSALAARACTAAGVMGALLALATTLSSLVSMDLADVNQITIGTVTDRSQPLGQILRSASVIAVSTSIAALVCGVFAVLIQTRGKAIHNRGARWPSRLGLFTRVVGLPISLAIGILGGYLILPELIVAVRSGDSIQVSQLLMRLAGQIVKLIVVGMLVLAVLLVFVSRLRFPFEARWASRRTPRQ